MASHFQPKWLRSSGYGKIILFRFVLFPIPLLVLFPFQANRGHAEATLKRR